MLYDPTLSSMGKSLMYTTKLLLTARFYTFCQQKVKDRKLYSYVSNHNHSSRNANFASIDVVEEEPLIKNAPDWDEKDATESEADVSAHVDSCK
jgi:hypothetical protein